MLAPDAIGTEISFSAALSASSSASITIGANANMLIAGLLLGGSTFASNVSVTWNGVSLNLLNSANNFDGASNSLTSYIFALPNPAAGAHTLAASWSSPSSTGSLAAVSFNGAIGAGRAAGSSNIVTPNISLTPFPASSMADSDITVGCAMASSSTISGLNGTTVFLDNSGGTFQTAMWFGRTQTLTGLIASAQTWVGSLVDVADLLLPNRAAPSIIRVKDPGSWKW